MHQLQILNITNVSFDVILAKIFEFTVSEFQAPKADDLPFLVINFIHSPSLQS